MKTKQKQNIIEHGQKLNIIFKTDLEPLDLCKKLRRRENSLGVLAEQWCNGTITEGHFSSRSESIMRAVDKILNFTKQNIPVFYNTDPRGYALKIKDDYVRKNSLDIERDWGGYGLIAPEIK